MSVEMFRSEIHSQIFPALKCSRMLRGSVFVAMCICSVLIV